MPAALVVEDNLIVLELMAEVLAQLGYQVVQAPDGDVAFEAMAAGDFQILLADRKLPGTISGEDVTAHFRTLFPAARIIMTSGDQRPSAAAGEVVFLQKPFTLRELKTLVGPIGAHQIS